MHDRAHCTKIEYNIKYGLKKYRTREYMSTNISIMASGDGGKKKKVFP